MSSDVLSAHADLEDVRIFYQRYGHGPELIVLLHGWPQTSQCWRHILPALGPQYTVVAPDLRGYGASGLAANGYSKRATAEDLNKLIRYLGHESAAVAGHDRGARVAHRWALDHPRDVTKLALLDILPSRDVMTTFDRASAVSMWHWFFHLQPDLPELLLKHNVEPYLRSFLRDAMTSGAIDEKTFRHYVEAFSDPDHLHATLEDYRSGFNIDLETDEEDYREGKLLEQPVLLLWGTDGPLGKKDVVGRWKEYATDIRGTAIQDCKHYLPEEQPEQVTEQLRQFFTA